MDYSEQIHKSRSFLANHDIGVVATSTPDGHSHASIINYFMKEPFEIYFLARENAQKFKNITVNPWTCLVVFDEGLTCSVEVQGHAQKLDDSPKVTDLLMNFAKHIRQRNAGPLPILKHTGFELYLFRLKPQHIAYANFRPSHERDGEYFEITL